MHFCKPKIFRNLCAPSALQKSERHGQNSVGICLNGNDVVGSLGKLRLEPLNQPNVKGIQVNVELVVVSTNTHTLTNWQAFFNLNGFVALFTPETNRTTNHFVWLLTLNCWTAIHRLSLVLLRQLSNSTTKKSKFLFIRFVPFLHFFGICLAQNPQRVASSYRTDLNISSAGEIKDQNRLRRNIPRISGSFYMRGACSGCRSVERAVHWATCNYSFVAKGTHGPIGSADEIAVGEIS